MADSSFTEISTHDLWIAARQFDLDIARPSPDTIKLTVRYPLSPSKNHSYSAIDGAVLTLGTKALTPNSYPTDGVQYTSASTIWNDVNSNMIGYTQVVSFWSNILDRPLPTEVLLADGVTVEFSVIITGTDPNTLYYASVHACTNVLQYYPIGIQSYPLEASRIEKDSSSFTGSIPSLPSAPTSPTVGMVYFDQQLNCVQYWDAAQTLWVPTRTDAIITGEFNPGILGHAHMLAGNVLKIFDGATWVTGTALNTQLRVADGWVPLNAVSSLTELPKEPLPGDLVYSYTTQRVQYWDGLGWHTPSPSTSLFMVGSSLVPAFTVQFSFEGSEMVTPYSGLLFYNTSQRQLNVFNGSTWHQANTAQQGTNITDKIGIGNDGSYDERLRLINILKAQLGWPAVCIELSEEQFNIAIDNALDTYRQLSVGGYEQRYFTFRLIKDQLIYYLNSPVDRTDSVVSVMKIHRLNLFGVTGSGPDNTWGQAFAQQFYNLADGGGNMLSTHLIHSWAEDFTRMFAGDVPFTWNEARRELTLKRAIRQDEKIVLEVECERSEQELLLDRWCKQFLQNWALAECKEYLGMIRSKYSSGTPGANGTITLNGDTLLAESRQDFTELKEALLNYEYQNAEHSNLAFLFA
jgi:hypothetical protein